MAKLREINGTWVADYRHNGKRTRASLGSSEIVTRATARAAFKDLVKGNTRAVQILAAARGPSFGLFAHRYLEWHAVEFPSSHERVAQITEDYLVPTFGATPLPAITPESVETWKRGRASEVKSQTVTKELRTLKAIINKALEWKLIQSSPIEHVAAPKNLDSKPARYFTKDELALIYAACRMPVNAGEGPQPNPLHAHWWKLYANTGLRRTEGINLRWSWIGQEGMKILSTEELRTKSGKWRDVPLTDGAREALEGLRGEGEFVLPRITLPSLSRAAARDIRRAGVAGAGLHTFRHTYISHLVMAGVSLRTVQQLAGHSSITVTEKYAHLAPGYLAQAGRAISL